VSTFQERVHAMTTTRHLPEVVVPLSCWRRLVAMRERLITEDPSLAKERGRGMEHVVYAAIMQGLRADEAEAGLIYDENTGLPRLSANDQAVLDRIKKYCSFTDHVRSETLRVRLVGISRLEIDDSLARLVRLGLVERVRVNSYRVPS